MSFVFSPDPGKRRRKRSTSALALCWTSGLVCGMLVYLSAGSSLTSLMRSTMGGTVSIVSLLYMALLPFLISAFAVSFFRPTLFLICFGKAFLFAFASLGLFRAFGSAGWLVFRLILFSDCMLLPMLYFLWLRLLRSPLSHMELACFIALTVLVVSVNYRIISPILASLIEI